jgi:hypothetical protein
MTAVEPVEPELYASLARFLAGWPGETLDEGAWLRRFALWWDANPFLAPGAPRGWTVRDGNRVVGFFGVVPMPFQIAGRETIVYASTTWRIDERFRHLSLTAISNVLRHARDSLLFVWTGNDGLVKVLKAFKFRLLPRGDSFYARQPSVLVLRLAPVVDYVRTAAGRSPVSPRLLAAPGMVFSAHARTIHGAMKLFSQHLTTRRVERADASFDDLWRRTRGWVANTNVRSADYLNWHCFAAPDYAKRLYACRRSHEGPLVGLAIVCEKIARGTRVLECVDLWTDPSEPRALDSLMSEVINDARRSKAAAVELPPYSEAIRRFARWRAFLPRRAPNRGEYFLGPRHAFDTVTEGTSYFCALQGDMCL